LHLGLVEVAHIESYESLVFGDFHCEAAQLIEHLGDTAWCLNTLVERSQASVLVEHKMKFEGYRKLCAEHFE
jgi:hypothetical protein